MGKPRKGARRPSEAQGITVKRRAEVRDATSQPGPPHLGEYDGCDTSPPPSPSVAGTWTVSGGLTVQRGSLLWTAVEINWSLNWSLLEPPGVLAPEADPASAADRASDRLTVVS